MFTWDSSGCMSKESVSITKDTNSLIEKARNAKWSHILRLHTLGCNSSCNIHMKSSQITIDNKLHFKVSHQIHLHLICSKQSERKDKCGSVLGRRQLVLVRNIWHHHGDWTWQASGTPTSLNHQVGLNRHRLLFHLHTVSESTKYAREEWVAAEDVWPDVTEAHH